MIPLESADNTNSTDTSKRTIASNYTTINATSNATSNATGTLLVTQLKNLTLQPVVKPKSENSNKDTLVVVGGITEKEEVHIRKIQRTARNYMTTIDGLSSKNNFDKMIRKMKKQFHCNGSYSNLDAESNSSKSSIRVTLTGDQRQNVVEFLVKEGICKKENMTLHGC